VFIGTAFGSLSCTVLHFCFGKVESGQMLCIFLFSALFTVHSPNIIHFDDFLADFNVLVED